MVLSRSKRQNVPSFLMFMKLNRTYLFANRLMIELEYKDNFEKRMEKFLIM